LASQLETFLRIGAASAGVVALMGLPPVYTFFNSFEIPTHYIGFDNIAKAGILPATSLLLPTVAFFYVLKYAMQQAPNLLLVLAGTISFVGGWVLSAFIEETIFHLFLC
jgi:hypothetical protein